MNKVEKIKDWISKTQDGLMDSQGNFGYPEHEGAYHILCNLDAYIDSLQEEPVSEDLEEAAKKAGQEYFPNENNIWARPNYEAKAAEYAFKAGAQWQKERILNNAIEREVKVDAGGYPYIDVTELYDYDKDSPLAKEGDKVKLIIIVEE